MFTTLLQAQAQGNGGLMQILMIVGIIVIFYFFMIRPQSKRSKAQRQFREGLKKGQRIITIGGIHGKILEINETSVIIEVEGQSRLKMEKSAISSEVAPEQIGE